MPKATELQVIDSVQRVLNPLTGRLSDYDPLLQQIGDAHIVLIGEASHGTYEFYNHRAEITKRLIQEKGFHAVAVEADWPDAHRVNRYVSLNRSRAEVVRYLEKVDPTAASRARQRYACFDHYGEDEQAYGYAAGFGMSESCEGEVVQQLVDLQRRTYEYMHRDGQVAEDEFFSAEQNARLVKNAEEYYRSMFRGRESTWNLRDRHMAETLHALLAHLDRRFGRSKVVVWAHNSHLGDARATQMGRRGEWNLGQLVRERYSQDSFSVGFTTFSGTVTAAHDWGDDPQTMRVRPAVSNSYEALLRAVGNAAFLLTFAPHAQLSAEFRTERLERAIGVVYRPETERVSHYFYASLPDQFDAVLHIDETRALPPLTRYTEPHPEEVPETFPSGI
ncbi:MAG TPA: erythromycin esterase family protein [Bryobacteraceae bacterium]|nr:erythromycin esterase family protein [Bryobacteraceae bacterium]